MADNPGSIYESPAYLAFVRGGDFSLEEAARQAARKQQAIGSALAINMPELEQQGAQQQENIAGSAETRGMARSGQRYNDQAQAAAANQAAQNRMRLNAADQIGQASEGLAQKVADIQMRAGELGYDTAGKMDLMRKTTEMRDRYAVQDTPDLSEENYGL